MLMFRRFGLAVLAVAAVAVFFLLVPDVPDDQAGDFIVEALELAESNYELNNLRAETAPQQQVVNGWYANNLLNLIAAETGRTATQSSDDRTAALLVIGILAIALWGATTQPAEVLPLPPPKPEVPETPQPAEPEPPVPDPPGDPDPNA